MIKKYLFTRSIQEETPYHMPFADDTVLVDERKHGIKS